MAVRKHAIYRLLPEPAEDAAEAGCYLTGSRGPCVDTGRLIMHEGNLTLSVQTIKDLAEVAGFSVNEEGQQLEELAEHLVRENEDLKAQLADANDQLEAVGKAVARAAQKASE